MAGLDDYRYSRALWSDEAAVSYRGLGLDGQERVVVPPPRPGTCASAQALASNHAVLRHGHPTLLVDIHKKIHKRRSRFGDTQPVCVRARARVFTAKETK